MYKFITITMILTGAFYFPAPTLAQNPAHMDAQNKKTENELPAIPGIWRVSKDGRYTVALFTQSRILRLCVDENGAVVTLSVDGKGLELAPGVCSDVEGKDFKVKSRGPASKGVYAIVGK